MSEKNHWTLPKIREAYGEILGSYNVLFPIQLGGKKKDETALDAFDPEGDNFYLDFTDWKTGSILLLFMQL